MATTFKNLEQLFKADRERIVSDNTFFIVNGFFPTWATEHRTNADRGLRRYLTDLRWDQYTSGQITREKAVELAVKRMTKQEQKKTEEGLAMLERVANAPDLEFVSVSVNWMKSRTWGYCPRVETWSNYGRFYGHASGCGYDKESAAVADAFNNDLSILKVLYTIKENGLANGQNDQDATACTGHDNRNIVGYGAGYSVLPRLEGGVGVGCFWSILSKAGFATACNSGKYSTIYTVRKGA